MNIVSKDQLHQTISLSDFPKRITSLVPSQTELLYSFGLNKEVVGITKFCVHPHHWFKTKQRVGGTKAVKIDLVKQLQPDLILANKEENVKEQIEALQSIAPVWVSDVKTLDDALQMITGIGEIVGKTEQAINLSQQILDAFAQLKPLNKKIKTAYLIWKDPLMAAGGDTFVNDMMLRCGFENILSNTPRYPETSVEKLKELGCELLLLSSEPFPFKQKHANELQQRLPDTKIMLVDGEMFSWYGSRLLIAAKYFQGICSQLNAYYKNE